MAALCSRQGHRVSFFDRRETGDDVRATAALGIERIQTVAGAEVDICIAAPGVPIDHPELRALRARGVETIGEVEWVFRTVPGTFIGVTGTAGKGTTTSWIHHLLQGAGSDAVAGGNLDPALAAVARPQVTMVVELSSFQLERCPQLPTRNRRHPQPGQRSSRPARQRRKLPRSQTEPARQPDTRRSVRVRRRRAPTLDLGSRVRGA